MTFPRIQLISALLSACMLAAVLRAQSPDPLADPESGAMLVRAFKPRDYQGSPVVIRVLEHPVSGEILLLAGTSLHVFDGVQWTTVPTETPAVRCLAVDAAGRVWMGGVDQLGYAQRDPTGQWRFQPLAAQLPEPHRKIGRVWDCTVTPDSVWFGTETKAVRWHQNAFTVFEFPSTGTLLTAGGQVFFQIKNKALHRWDGTAFRAFSVDPLVAGLSIMRLFATTDGALEGMTSAGIFFRLRDRTVEAIAPHAKAALGSARLVCALPRPAGGWYVGTDNAGLLILDRDGRLARKLTRADGFTDGPIADLTHDRSGALWAATFSGPMQIEQPEAVTFFGPAQGLPESISNGLERHQGRLYVGAPAGLLRLVPGRGVFEPTPGSPRFPQKLLPQPDGLLVAHANGIARLHDDAFTSIFESTNTSTALAASRRDPRTLFVGRSAGFTVLRRETGGTAREVRHFADLGQVRDVDEDDQGAVWIATSTRGVHRITPAKGDDSWARATVTTFDTKSRTLAGTSDSTLALHTPFGLSFNTPSGHVRFDATSVRMVTDDRFRLGERVIPLFGVTAVRGHEGWATASFEGENAPPIFGRIEPTGPATAQFHPVPPSVQEVLGPIDGGRILIEGDGTQRIVWSRTVEGLARLRPAALSAAPPAWSVHLTRFEAIGANQPLARTVTPRFAHSRQPYIFSFHAPRVERGAQVEYQTRLIGWDPQWSAFSPARETRYSALPAGQYRFEVRARDRLGRVSEPAAHAFGITPPAWLTGWAFASYALTLAAGVLGIVRWRVARLEREQRRLEGLVATRTSELATARDAAESANRAKSAFLASMSHELRTPLNGVIGYAQVLQADRRLAPDQQERVRIVQSSGQHLLRMINDVLDLAKIEAGKIILRPAPCALSDLLRDLAAAHAPAAHAKNLSFHLDLAPTLPAWVECDAQKLRQILDNLLGNAVKFTTSGRVTLHVVGGRVPAPAWDSASSPTQPCGHRDGPAHLQFAITDTGPGISPADQTRLFQAFEQANDARADAQGTGLGLAISRALVERLGGQLSLASAPGTGSTFSFALDLPTVTPLSPAQTAAQRIVGYEGSRRRVVIVDDHDINRRLLFDLLTPLGFDCADFASPQIALARLTAGAEPWPDLAIVDVRMTGLDGLAFTRALRALPRGAQLKVLLTSASVLSFDVSAGQRAGADDFIAKPFLTADLLEKIGRLLSLGWRQADSAPPFAPSVPASDSSPSSKSSPSSDSPKSSDSPPLSAAVLATLREHLAHGDLDAFRAAVASLHTAEPSAALAALDEAAARYDLPCLRALLA